jgi:hypothetical protein
MGETEVNRVNAMREYITLLEDELREVMKYVPDRWKSTRYRDGVRLRKAIGDDQEAAETG